jgi:hypothetical protein
LSFQWLLTASDSSQTQMTGINSLVQPELTGNLFACGYLDTGASGGSYAVVYRFDDNGVPKLFYRWGDGSTNKDTCQSIRYDRVRKELVMLLEVTSPSLRPDYNTYSSESGNNKDLLIVRMSESGVFRSATNINFERAGASFFLPPN